MTKIICGASPRCGKSINYHICPDCQTPLKQIDETTYCCPVCKHKLKALTYPVENMTLPVEAPKITGTLQSTENSREVELKKWFIKRLNENVGRGPIRKMTMERYNDR